ARPARRRLQRAPRAACQCHPHRRDRGARRCRGHLDPRPARRLPPAHPPLRPHHPLTAALSWPRSARWRWARVITPRGGLLRHLTLKGASMTAALLFATMLAAAQTPAAPFDLLVRGGRLVDGTGNPAVVG